LPGRLVDDARVVHSAKSAEPWANDEINANHLELRERYHRYLGTVS